MCGTALAAASRSTVMRTISDPARASAADWAAVASMSAVSVLVIDCTTIGASPPTRTWPMDTETEERRVGIYSEFYRCRAWLARTEGCYHGARPNRSVRR